jgi:hypothetical protein
MKKRFLLSSLLIGVQFIFLAVCYSGFFAGITFAVTNGLTGEWAMIDNGMTILLMLSAFYMIGKNFMFQKQMDQIKEKVRVLLNNIKLL